MTKEQIDKLLEANNYDPSAYEERYVRWADLSYNRERLHSFLASISFNRREIKECSEMLKDPLIDEIGKKEYNLRIKAAECNLKIMEETLNHLDFNSLLAFLQGDPEAERQAAIEKYAKDAAIEMVTEGKFSFNTLSVISNFPQADFVLVLKRCQELVALITNVTTQATSMIEGVPGA